MKTGVQVGRRARVNLLFGFFFILAEQPLPAEELTERAVLQGHKADVANVVFTPDGKTIATASRDQTIRLWETASGKNICTLDGAVGWRGAGHVLPKPAIAISLDGKTLASVSPTKIGLWDMTTGKSTGTLAGDPGQRHPGISFQSRWQDPDFGWEYKRFGPRVGHCYGREQRDLRTESRPDPPQQATRLQVCQLRNRCAVRQDDSSGNLVGFD